MSNKKRRNQVKLSPEKAALRRSESISGQTDFDKLIEPNSAVEKTVWSVDLKQHWGGIAVIVFLSVSILGAGLKYLDESAKSEIARRAKKGQLSGYEEQSLLSQINPFVPAPLPSASPQISKEYIYAGSRVLSVEDTNANAVPPADLGIWRPSTGYWWVLNANGSNYVSIQWGISTDKPALGDYDGDGKTDFSVFRPNEGKWYIQRSSDNVTTIYSFGLSGDKLAQADYDADGKTDIAIYRDGTWYIQRSSDSGVSTQQFGLSSDVPAVGDYDGDGKADYAVWRGAAPSTFYVLRSSNSQLQTALLGQSGDIPVTADYDGDERADYAIKRGADWIFLYSSNSQTQTITWQQSGDQAVQNDYDGDGKVDIAVWRESNGNWYIRQSSLNGQLRQAAWGTAGDKPVPAFYNR